MKYRGLTAAAVAQSREKYGANTMPEPHAKTAWEFLLDVFRDKINIILLIMTIIFAVLAILGFGELTEALGIGAVLVIVCGFDPCVVPTLYFFFTFSVIYIPVIYISVI